MFYKFPQITRIEPVLEAIKGSDDFRVTEKEGYKVINYNLASSSTFPQVVKSDEPFVWTNSTPDGAYAHAISPDQDLWNASVRRECRGLIFGNDGNLIRRAYHKFFNLNEREETLIDLVDFSSSHIILEKIDGSMVTPLFLPDETRGTAHLRLATKAGITDVSMEAEVFISDKPWYKEFMTLCYAQGLMPIFEYVSPETRIVINHKEPNLILTAIRNQITGEYQDYTTMRVNALHWNIPLVNFVYSSSQRMSDEYMKDLETSSDTEGIVIRFNNGHMLKIKTLWYVAIHRAKDNLLHEKRVVELILEDKVDDVLGFLDPEDRDRLDSYRTSFVNGLDASIKLLRDHYYPKAKSMSRKDFALGLGKEIPWSYTSIIFNCWDKSKDEIETEIMNTLRKSLTSQAKIDNTRHLWGNAVWNFKVLHE